VLEPLLGVSRFPNHGERVIAGQRLMQAEATSCLAGCAPRLAVTARAATSTSGS
jgi:hypothetical protein